MDVENIDALNPAELDALLERALNPQVPVEVFYAVLERIGSHEPATETAPPHAGADAAAQARTVRPGQPAQVAAPAPLTAQQGSGPQSTTALPPPPQPLPVALPSQGSQASAPAAHQQAAPGPGPAHQQSNAQSGSAPQPAPAGRRAAQHGPPPRGFVLPVADTEATTVFRAVTGTEDPARADPATAAAPPPDGNGVSATAQTTLMPAVPAAEAEERPENPSR